MVQWFANKHAINVPRAKENIHKVIVYCKDNQDKRVIQVVATMALPGLSPTVAPQKTYMKAVTRFNTGRSRVPSILITLSASPSGQFATSPGLNN